MSELAPYIGIALIIAVGAIAVIVLAHHGLRLKRLKHDRTELEFETGELPEERTEKPVSETQLRVTEGMIQLSESAEADCDVLGIRGAAAIEFVIGEATRHPILFQSTFISIPLVFGSNVLLLSWDESTARIERILNRQQAYPLNDIWSSCLAAYRKATLLPYRAKGPEKLYVSAEARRSLAVYRRLVGQVREFLSALQQQGEEPPSVYQDLQSLLEEAEFALVDEDMGTSIARMEVVLSITHKLILQFAPRGPLAEPQPAPPKPGLQLPEDPGTTVLVVDDDDLLLRALKLILERRGLTVVTACTVSGAFKALVEHEFDLVSTDLMMPGLAVPGYGYSMDGREVALAAKRSSAKTKVVVFTGYGGMARSAELMEAGVDRVVEKGCSLMNLLSIIEALL